MNATGYGRNPGIGGTPYDATTNISISNGTVFAAKGANAFYDIGSFDKGEGILNISGRAKVFLRNDKYRDPITTTTHSHRTSDPGFSGSSFGGIPVSWKGSFGAFLRVYTLSYNINGGSGIVRAPVEQHIATTIAVSGSGGISKDHCTFSGWNTRSDGGGTSYAANGTFTFAANATLYAQWTPYAYTVAYNSNGGSGTIEPSSHMYGVYQALDANTFTRTGYTFAGWARGANGAVELKDEESILNLTSVNGGTVTLYAKWTLNTYNVVYDKNGGNGGATAPSSHTYNIAKALTTNGYLRTGYNFLGWATSPGNTVAYIDGENVTNLTVENGETITLYAVWASSGKYFIKTSVYNAKYGKVNGAGTYAGGDRATLTAIPVSGYRFAKWMEGTKTLSPSYAVYSFTVEKARSLKAYFEKIETPRLSSVKALKKGAIKVTWKAVPGAKGYTIYRATSKWGKYAKVKAIEGTLSFIDTALKAKKAYYYKVQAYCVAGEKTTTGGYSKVLSAKAK